MPCPTQRQSVSFENWDWATLRLNFRVRFCPPYQKAINRCRECCSELQRARRPRPRRRPEIRTGLRRRSCDWHLWRLSVNSRTDADDGDDDSVSARANYSSLHKSRCSSTPTGERKGIGIGECEWPSFVPDANGKREEQGPLILSSYL